jgi:Protein of unknown function (DUF2877)
VAIAGVASLALRDLLRGPRRTGRLLAVLPRAIYLEFPEGTPEPRVIAVSAPDSIRLPNAVIATPFPSRAGLEQFAAADTTLIEAGEGQITTGSLMIRIARWWDPSPVFGPVSRSRLDHNATALARRRPDSGLEGHQAPAELAASCAAGDLAGAVEAAERLAGLGPGLIPSGDGIVCGVLLALRLLGGAISGGTRAVWLADWLGAAATGYAAQRTTALAAALLHCAAGGQAAAEASGVLLGIAGQEPLEPAASRLLADTAGADLAWGLVAGCRAALKLSVS